MSKGFEEWFSKNYSNVNNPCGKLIAQKCFSDQQKKIDQLQAELDTCNSVNKGLAEPLVKLLEMDIKKLQQQNQELRDNEQILADKINDLVDRMKIYEGHDDTIIDLKAFIKEACEVIEFYSHTKVRSDFIGKQGNVMSSHVYDISCATCNETQKGKRAKQFMNTDKYKEYSSDRN